MYQKIVLGVDGSAPSQKALEQAVSLGEKYGAEVIVMTVITPPASYNVEFSGVFISPVVDPEVFKIIEKKGHELLQAAAGVFKEKGIKHQVLLKVGVPAEELVEVASREKADIILLGSRGLSGVDRFLLGSTSERVVRHAPCSVLVVR